MKDTLILGIESSCDETACAIVRNGREILSDVIASQADFHEQYGGVVPELDLLDAPLAVVAHDVDVALLHVDDVVEGDGVGPEAADGDVRVVDGDAHLDEQAHRDDGYGHGREGRGLPPGRKTQRTADDDECHAGNEAQHQDLQGNLRDQVLVFFEGCCHDTDIIWIPYKGFVPSRPCQVARFIWVANIVRLTGPIA